MAARTRWSLPVSRLARPRRVLLTEGIPTRGRRATPSAPATTYYTVVATQSEYFDGEMRKYGGEIHLEHQAAQASPGGLSYGEFCYFP